MVLIVLLASQTWDPAWNPFKQQFDQSILQKSIENLSSLETAKYKTSLKASVSASEAMPASSFALLLEGGYDNKNPEQKKSQNEISLLVQGAQDISVTLAILGFTDELYLKINQLPAIVYALLNEELLNSLTGQWIRVEQETLKEFTGFAVDSNPENEAISQAFINDLKNLAFSSPLLIIEKELSSENQAKHYLTSVSKEGVKTLLSGYFDLIKNHFPEIYNQQLSSANLEQTMNELPQKIDEFWPKISPLQAEIWISREDSRLTKFSLEKEFKPSDFDSSTSATGKVLISFDLELYDFDQPLQIEKPNDYLEIEEVLGPLMTSIAPDIENNIMFEGLEIPPEIQNKK